MIGTTFYQQRQMQKASPPGAASGQQQAILKLMPIMFGIFGYTFPAGLTLYWTVSNTWQIGQQYVLLKAGHIGPDAMERRIAEQRAKNANKPAKPGLMARMQERAEQSQKAKGSQPPKKPGSGQKSTGNSRSAPVARARRPKGRRPNTGGRRRARRSRVARPSRADGRTRIRRSVVEVTVARETEKRAPSVEEAVEAALHELGVSEQEARIDVLQEPRSGVLGIGSHEAVVRVRVVAPEVDPEDLEEQADTAADFLEELMGHMGIDAVAEPNLHHDHMYVDIVGEDEDDMALLIGRHGQTLDAIQELTRMVVGRRLDERVRVIVDVEDYRKRREERLEDKAREVAARVLSTGTEEALEPMNPFERKIVHDAVSEIDGVESSSIGVEPDRAVVIRRR